MSAGALPPEFIFGSRRSSLIGCFSALCLHVSQLRPGLYCIVLSSRLACLRVVCINMNEDMNYCMETDPDGFTCHESSIWSTLLERNSNVGAFSPACDGGPVTTGTSVKKEGIRGSSRCQADSRRGGP